MKIARFKERLTLSVMVAVATISLRATAQIDLESALGGDSTERASEEVETTFKSGRIINSQSPEATHIQELDFKVELPFGDSAGINGGARNFFVLDNSTHIKIRF